jgi:hypothetical protein
MILSHDSETHKERAMAGYFTDMHFYPIDEYSHLRRLNEVSHHVSKPLESLPVPEFEKRRKPQTAYERKCMYDAENSDIPGPTSAKASEEAKKWNWAEAQHVIVDNPSNVELWEIINNTPCPNKCQLYILHQTDMIEFSDWAKFTHKTILAQNPEATCIKGRNELKDRIRLLAIDEDEYEVAMHWCQKNGVAFSSAVNLHSITMSEYYEAAGWEAEVTNKKAEDYVLSEELAKGMIASYGSQDVNAGRAIDNLITPAEFIEMYKKSPYCSASGRFLVPNVYSRGEKETLSLDRINNSLAHTCDNVRIMSLYDNKCKALKSLAQYRFEEQYCKSTVSDYTNGVMTALCGTPEKPHKSKALTATVRFPDGYREFVDMNGDCDRPRKLEFDDVYKRLHATDVQKAHTCALYQGVPDKYAEQKEGNIGIKQNGFKEFDNKTWEWPVFTAYDQIQKINDNSADIEKPGIFYVKFVDGEGPSTHDGHTCFTNGWYYSPIVYYFRKVGATYTVSHARYARQSLPADYFQRAIDNILKYLPGQLGKNAINILVGYLGKTSVSSKTVYDTTDINEAMHFFLNRGIPSKNTFSAPEYQLAGVEPDETYYHVVTKDLKWLQSNSVQIYEMVVQVTAVRTYQMYLDMVTGNNGRVIPHDTIQFRTDCAMVQFHEFEGKLESMENTTDPFYRPEICANLLNVSESPIVYVWDGDFNMPAQNWNKPMAKPEKPGLYAFMVSELSQSTPDMPNYSKDQTLLSYVTKTKINMDGSFAILGPGGCGKSHFVSLIHKYYKQLEEEDIMVTAFTNEVCANYLDFGIKAYTLHSGLGIDMKTDEPFMIREKLTTLVVDEVSMVPSKLLSLILKLKRSVGFRVIAVGDFTQLNSVEQVYQASIEEREHSDLLGDICDWQRLWFTQNLRSDDTIFNIRNQIVKQRADKPFADLQDFVTSHYAGNDIILRGLCKTHYKRNDVNRNMMNLWLQHVLPTLQYQGQLPITFKEKNSAHRDATTFNFKATLTYMMPVSCEMRDAKLRLTKGDRLFVYTWTDEHIILLDLFNVQYNIPRDKFATHFRLAFCTTVHRAQGSTIKQKYMLFEHNKYDWRMANVAVTRCTKHEDVVFEYIAPPLPVVIPAAVYAKPIEHKPLLQHIREDGLAVKTFKKLVGEDSITTKCENIHEKIIVRDQSIMKFHVFDSVSELENVVSYPNQTLHELVWPSTIQRVHFDIDLKVSEFTAACPNQNAQQFVDNLVSTIRRVGLEYTKTYSGDIQISSDEKYISAYTRTYSSCSESKLSYHVMLPIYCGGYAQSLAREIFLDIRKLVMAEFPHIPAMLLEQILDSGMSRTRGSLRMLGSVKDTTFDRPKIDEQEDELTDDLAASLIGWYDYSMFAYPPIYIHSQDDKYEVVADNTVSTETQTKIKDMMAKDSTFSDTWTFRNDTLNCTRQKPSMCPNCSRKHDNDNTLYFTIHNNDVYQRCFHKAKSSIYVGSL